MSQDYGSSTDSQLAGFLKEHRAEYGVAAVLAVLLLLNLSGLFQKILGVDTALLVTAAAGYKTFFNSISALMEKKISADLALCVAVIAALSAGEFLAAAEAMFIVMVGETLESYAAGRTEAAIQRFVTQTPRIARVLVNGREQEVDPASLIPGDRILTRAGERIAADGMIEYGCSSIDESSITGEPVPKDKETGDEVFSGTLNGNGLLRIRVTRAGPETTLARVVQLVEEAKGKRAPVERLADHYARYFLPALLLAGALTFYFTGNWLRTVAVLIVACPCALILATPTAMVAAIGGLARRGILVRGGAVLERAAKVDTIVFDKTGTVTEGRFAVSKVMGAERSELEVLALAAAAERASSHAFAHVIVAEAERRKLDIAHVENARVVPGRGVECTINGRAIRAGNAAYMAENGIADGDLLAREADRLGATPILVAIGTDLAGAIFLTDRVREGAYQAARRLSEMGISDQWLLTGDRRAAAEIAARQAGISNVEAELLPEQKLDRVRQLAARSRGVAMVGDGINDAPALAAASVGIAVAGASDITAEAADVVYLPHSLDQLPMFFAVAERAMRTAWLNIVLFAGALNLLAVIACATGRLGPIGAALTHQLSSFCVMMNSLRLLRTGDGCAPFYSKAAAAWSRVRNLDPGILVEWVAVHRGLLARAAFFALASFTVLSGFYVVRPDEAGVIERFGRKSLPFRSPGLHYKLPWPIERLTRIRPHAVRVVEIGYRSDPRAAGSQGEPASYEWNVAHRSGRFQSRLDESLLLTGDQNIIELNAAVHYDVQRADEYLFRQIDADATLREAAESVVHGIAATTPMDELLTTERRAIEERARIELQRRADKYQTGIRVIQFKLEDVHPSREVVGAFRDVSAAFEEKNRIVNEAEGYRNEQVSLARGNAAAQLRNAAAYAAGRTNRAEGDASRFISHEEAFRTAPGPTETRLYLETMEQVLTGRKKVIVDAGKGRRHLMLLDDGVEIAPALPSGGDPRGR